MDRWPLNKAYFWETAPFFRFLLPLAAGILCYDRKWFPAMPDDYLILLMGAAFLLYAVVLYVIKSVNPIITFLLVNVIMVLIGVWAAANNDVRNDKKWFGNNIKRDGLYLVRIEDHPAEKESTWRLPVMVRDTVEGGKSGAAWGKAMLYVYKDRYPMTLHKGDTLLLPGKWQQIGNAGNPFEFDYARYCRRNNLLYQQFCSAHDIRLYAPNNPNATPILEKSHDWCMGQLDKYITDPVTKGLLQAMLLGDEVNLKEELRQSYSETGVIHIIAISGGNVEIFFIVISWLLWWWLRDAKHAWVKYIIALPLIWFYVLMAGMSPSAIRAAMMFSLIAISMLLQKNENGLNQLFATAFVLLFAEPTWLFSVGFQLSFVAVLSLILFYKPLNKWLFPLNAKANRTGSNALTGLLRELGRQIRSAFIASLAAEILVAPLVIYYFHTFPLLFLVANVAAFLFMSVVLIMSIAIILLSWFPFAAAFAGVCTTWLVTVLDKVVAWMQGFNPESFHFLLITGIEMLLIYAGIAGISLFLLKRQKGSLSAGLMALCVLFMCFCRDEWLRLHQRHFVVYSAGQNNHIELIRGYRYSEMNADTGSRKKVNYAIKAAHTGWQAWEKDPGRRNEILLINDKAALVLNRDIDANSPFPVDYLVVNYAGKIDIVKLQKIFSPGLMIIGNNCTKKQQEDCRQKAQANGIKVHSITTDGAFVLSNND